MSNGKGSIMHAKVMIKSALISVFNKENLTPIIKALKDLNIQIYATGGTKDFILEPTEEFEKVGIEENVVFATSQVLIGEDLYVYYGGADKVICVATAKMKDLVDFAMSEPVKN